MKLLGLEIRKLYGNYNYTVRFNQDVTFLYGANGCGKTTVLNITEAIITGQLYKLFTYPFEKIELHYGKKANGLTESIIITQVKKQLHIVFNGELHTLDWQGTLDSRNLPERERRDRIRAYFSLNPFLKEICNTFNYVYLPLNRTHTPLDLEDIMSIPQ